MKVILNYMLYILLYDSEKYFNFIVFMHLYYLSKTDKIYYEFE